MERAETGHPTLKNTEYDNDGRYPNEFLTIFVEDVDFGEEEMDRDEGIGEIGIWEVAQKGLRTIMKKDCGYF